MEFSKILNKYIELLDCSSKELAESSGLSPAAISRYRNGERIPSFDSKQLNDLINGIIKLANKKDINSITYEKVFTEFNEIFGKNTIDNAILKEKLNILISELNINISQMAKFLGFDSSYISRIASGQRKPSDVENFIDSICKYIVKYYSNINYKQIIINILKTNSDFLNDEEKYFFEIKKWFYSFNKEKDTSVNTFLEKLDEFDLNNYIKAIHFDKLKVPSIPFHLPNSKNYYGLDEMKTGELDFFKSTILSKNSKTILMYSDMPIKEMSKDIEFSKKWMFAIACSIKKGLHLNVIHNLDRPFNELMIGLEGWIPIYMTGQVSPYYLKQNNNDVFLHFLNVSESSCLIGTGIKGKHKNAKYYLTSKKNELPFYQTMAKNLLKKAYPLMKIYTEDNKEEFEDFMQAEFSNKDNIIYTIDNKNLKNTFTNIDFKICKNSWILISKKHNPEINFVIYHPKLRKAIEKFVTPISEKEL